MPVILCECFARDGLQHDTVEVPTETKAALIDAMTVAGFPGRKVRVQENPASEDPRGPAVKSSSLGGRGYARPVE